MIIVLKNQDLAQPASRSMLSQRRQTLHSIQAPVLDQLSSSHARRFHSYTTLNEVSATVTPSEASALTSNPAIKEVVPDGLVRGLAAAGPR